MGEYARAAAVGIKSFLIAILGWRENPYTIAVGRRLWGRFPLVTLAGLTLIGIAAAPFFPSLERMAGFIPPLSFLMWLPGDVSAMLWSVPALLGIIIAWRVRSLRRDEEQLWFGLTDVAEPGRHIFEAAAIPIAAAASFLAIGAEIAGPVLSWAQGSAFELGGTGATLLSISHSLVITIVVAGVLSINQCFSKAFGQLFGAAFTLFGIRLGLSYAIPWMTSWWSYLPIPFVDRIGQRSPIYGLILVNLAILAIAWVALREKAEEQPFWVEESEEKVEDESDEDQGNELPPIPGN
jgi:hypothetical protein